MGEIPVDRNTIALWVHLFVSWQKNILEEVFGYLGGQVSVLCREIYFLHREHCSCLILLSVGLSLSNSLCLTLP